MDLNDKFASTLIIVLDLSLKCFDVIISSLVPTLFQKRFTYDRKIMRKLSLGVFMPQVLMRFFSTLFYFVSNGLKRLSIKESSVLFFVGFHAMHLQNLN